MSVPAAWTNVGAPDPVVALSNGSAAFRVTDLLALAHLLRELRSSGKKP